MCHALITPGRYILWSPMSDATCKVKEDRRMPLGPLRKVAHKVLYNRVIETAVVAAIAAGFLGASVVDGLLGTGFERHFIRRLQDVSRDRLNALRKAQIRYVFRCKLGLSHIRIRLAGGSYWLSIPCIVEGRRHGKKVKYMAKIINDMSAIKHRYMTMLRNLGVVATASELRFDEYTDAKDMAYFERYCLGRLREEAVNAPAVIGMYRLNEDDYMLVMEFIEGRPLSEVPIGDAQADQIFRDIRTIHDHGFVHGDIKPDNLLIAGDQVYVLDCLKVGYRAFNVAKSFDLICAICTVSQKLPVGLALEHAKRYFSSDDLMNAGRLLDFAISKVDIILPEGKVRELRQALGNPR
jgi:serine/threonine protein kinase